MIHNRALENGCGSLLIRAAVARAMGDTAMLAEAESEITAARESPYMAMAACPGCGNRQLVMRAMIDRKYPYCLRCSDDWKTPNRRPWRGVPGAAQPTRPGQDFLPFGN
jgi:hypothetical protein